VDEAIARVSVMGTGMFGLWLTKPSTFNGKRFTVQLRSAMPKDNAAGF
jgi:hypothetical protein